MVGGRICRPPGARDEWNHSQLSSTPCAYSLAMNAVRTYSTGSNTSPASRSLMYPPSIVRSLSDVGAAAGPVVGSRADSPRAIGATRS